MGGSFMQLALSVKEDFDDDFGISVPLLAALLSGVGTVFLVLLVALLWFACVSNGRIRLDGGAPGSFDDEQSLLEEERQVLDSLDDYAREEYLLAKEFQEHHPPNSVCTDISLSQFMTIQEKGVSAWEFLIDFPQANCLVENRTEIEFFEGGTCSVQTNLPIPKQNDVYYWEAKLFEKPADTDLAIGLATKPYPNFRLPGYHRYSVAYDSLGSRRLNQPFSAPHYGPVLQQGDVVGVGYRPRTGTVFFTRNGRKLEDALHGMRMNLFPTIGATNKCKVMVNFGRAGFVFIEANVKKWGLAPAQGSLAPPPPYGAEHDFVLLESGRESSSNVDAQDSFASTPPRGNEGNGLPARFANFFNGVPGHSPPPFDYGGDDTGPGGRDIISLAPMSSGVSNSGSERRRERRNGGNESHGGTLSEAPAEASVEAQSTTQSTAHGESQAQSQAQSQTEAQESRIHDENEGRYSPPPQYTSDNDHNEIDNANSGFSDDSSNEHVVVNSGTPPS